MWMRKSDKDRQTGRGTPVPTQIVGNEEFDPMPQTADQKRVERRIFELADQYSRRLGLSRRAFLQTSGGMAVSFMAMNEVFGPAFLVNEAEAAEPAASQEMWPKKEFILDGQTHHVKDSMPGPLGFRMMTGKLGLNPALSDVKPAPDSLHRGNYIKEIFFDSDTVMACITGAAIGPPAAYVLSPDEVAKTRDVVNELSGSRRMLCHGITTPNNPNWIEDAERQVKELKITTWKFYTGDPVGPWRHDDEKVAYPFYERSLKLGMKNICTHKGLPLPGPGQGVFPARRHTEGRQGLAGHQLDHFPFRHEAHDDAGSCGRKRHRCRRQHPLDHGFLPADPGVRRQERLPRTGCRLRPLGRDPPGCLRPPPGAGHRRCRCGPRDLGHGLHLVGLAQSEIEAFRRFRFLNRCRQSLVTARSRRRIVN